MINQPAPNLLKGSLLALLAFFFMALFGVFTKLAYEPGAEIWISFITYATGAIRVIILVIRKGLSYLKSTNYPYLYARAIIGTLASFLYMISLNYTSIVNSTLLFNTAPIFIPFLSIIWLKNSVQRTIWYAVALGFIGILVIIKPGSDIFTDPGNLIGLASGIALAIAYLLMKELTNTDPGLRIIFYYLFIGTVIQAPLLFFAGPLPSWESCLYAAVCGLMLLLAQLALVKAYTYASASQIGIYQYSTVAFVALIEWLLWNQTPSLSDFAGILLVCLAGIIIIRSKAKTNP